MTAQFTGPNGVNPSATKALATAKIAIDNDYAALTKLTLPGRNFFFTGLRKESFDSVSGGGDVADQLMDVFGQEMLNCMTAYYESKER